MILLYLAVGLLVFTIIGMPLGYSIGLSSMFSLLIENPMFLNMFPQRVWAGAYGYTMICLPLFMLMGELANKSGFTDNMTNILLYMVKPIRGGIAEVNVLQSMFFGGISGSSVADVVATGGLLMPAMKKQGYSEEFSAGLTVASSTMGIIIPPSGPMIMYSMITGASVSALFMGGIIPGILVALTQLIAVYILSKIHGYKAQPIPFEWGHFKMTLAKGLPTLVMPLLLLGSIAFGVATASEAAALAVFYVLLLDRLIYHKLTWKDIKTALRNTFLATSGIVVIIGFSMIFSWIMTMQQVPQTVAAFIVSMNLSRELLIAALIVLILIMGCFLDVSPAILMMTPILLPIAQAAGIGDVQFGIIFTSGLAIGLATPPVGMCLNACARINGMSVLKIARGALPFIVCNVIVLFLISYIPALTMWIPSITG